ncbi:MAG: GNAT family N-acetyltransferase [Bacteroidota bacterium]
MNIRLSRDKADMEQIVTLQAKNHKRTVDELLRNEQGFVSISHDTELLWAMHQLTPHVVADSDGEIVGYALSMEERFRHEIPDLEPTIKLIEKATYKSLSIAETPYLIMGQVCVAEQARGQKLVDRMYNFMRQTYHNRYRFFITEISLNNPRSIRVHERCGFEELFRHTDENDDWVTVILDWGENQETRLK